MATVNKDKLGHLMENHAYGVIFISFLVQKTSFVSFILKNTKEYFSAQILVRFLQCAIVRTQFKYLIVISVVVSIIKIEDAKL